MFKPGRRVGSLCQSQYMRLMEDTNIPQCLRRGLTTPTSHMADSRHRSRRSPRSCPAPLSSAGNIHHAPLVHVRLLLHATNCGEPDGSTTTCTRVMGPHFVLMLGQAIVTVDVEDVTMSGVGGGFGARTLVRIVTSEEYGPRSPATTART